MPFLLLSLNIYVYGGAHDEPHMLSSSNCGEKEEKEKEKKKERGIILGSCNVFVHLRKS